MAERVLDCHHVDITHIVEARHPALCRRKAANLLRYLRQYKRRGRK